MSLVRLGANHNSKQYDMGHLWAKFGAFRRIWTKPKYP